MTGLLVCPDCDGFGYPFPDDLPPGFSVPSAVCASCDGAGSLSPAELRRLVNNPRPIDFVDVLAGLLIFAYMAGCPLVILAIWMSR